ncbi:very short patch repair endonuclease [Agromyces sp. NPDC058136]|uniref:very short patch repair endonuclease n=1 Tax=Agromyces sp. NPDC058136 TaxID=3346354 RepID=UPI0036DBFAD0
MAEVRASWASSDGTRKSMLANRRRDTKTELAVRRLLHARGLRYRVDLAPLPSLRRRRADIVFTRAKVAVFIDGCFWHGCPEHATNPKQNADYWGPKLAANIARDRNTDTQLRAADWTVLRFWEHEDAERVAATIEAAVRPKSERAEQGGDR